MKQTTNYLMHLPEVSDYADIGVLNENTVKIDGELWKKADKKHSHPAGDITDFPAAIAGKADKRVPAAAGDITAGELPIARGGTGAGTAAAARGALDVWSKGECIDEATAAALGLPSTATPNDALGAFPFAMATTSIATEFGTRGCINGGNFSAPIGMIGNELSLNVGNGIGEIDFIPSETVSEYNIVYAVSSPRTELGVYRIRRDGTNSRIVSSFIIYTTQLRVWETQCIKTGTENEYICIFSEEKTQHCFDICLQRFKFNNNRYENVGSVFKLNEGISSWHVRLLQTEVATECIAITEISGAQVRRIQWTGTTFAFVGNEFRIPEIGNGTVCLLSTDVTAEYNLTNCSQVEHKLELRRIAWNGASFSAKGSVFVAVASSTLRNKRLILEDAGVQNEYVISYTDGSGSHCQRIAYSGGFYNSGNRLTVNASGADWDTVLKTDTLNDFVFAHRIVSGDAGYWVQNIKWDSPDFKKIEAPFRYTDKNVGTVPMFYTGYLKEFVAVSDLVVPYIRLKRLLVSVSNANALQKRNPNQKLWIAKE